MFQPASVARNNAPLVREMFVNDDGLIVGRTIRSSSAGDCCLTTNRYPLGQVNTR